ncbi:MAG TPA: hypothetical protein VMT03_00640 [Polyangia bacterium]|nr:hypothetical protein [Polyangia bacterium]
MIDLSEDDRAILELARDAHDPSDRDRARVRTELASRIGAAAGLGLAAGLGAAAKTTATAGAAATSGVGLTAGVVGATATVAKIVGAAVIVSAAVGATVAHRARHVPAARVAIVEKAPLARPAPAHQQVSQVAEVTPPVAPLPASRLVPGPEKQAPRAHALAAPRNVERQPTLNVGDETRLMQSAVLAMQVGQPGRALALLDQHARLYPKGVLAEERDAERALALADLGRVSEARAAIQQFLAAHGGSPMSARLRARALLLGP